MPGRLLHFNGAADATKKFLSKTSLRHPYNPNPGSKSSKSSSSLELFGLSSDPETMDLLKRHSIALGKAKRDPSKDRLPKHAALELVVESPPLVSYGSATESSGALFSGQILLNVKEPNQVYESIEVRLLCSTTIKKPVVKDCPDCSGTTKELKKWNFAKEPLALSPGEHKFPIQYLFAGNLPATTHCHLAMLDYYFSVEAKPKNGFALNLSKTVELQRAIRPTGERNSIRIFPPTNMTAKVGLTPVCYTNSDIPVSMRLDGIKTSTDKTETRWRLRRLLWRVEEYQKLVSPACSKHAHKVPEGQTGIKHEEVKVVGEHEVRYDKNPWKTDLSAGEIDAEFVASLNPSRKASCGVSVEEINLQIFHHLVVEMIVVEEFVHHKRPNVASPTGGARILRSQFPLKVTNRAGLGVAWDEETPPVYQDVPPSPPSYPSKAVATSETVVMSPFMTPGLAQVSDIDISSLEDFELGEPHELAGPSGVGSASTVSRRSMSSSSAEGSSARGSHVRFSADDLLQGPPEYFRRTDEEEEEVDIQSVPV